MRPGPRRVPAASRAGSRRGSQRGVQASRARSVTVAASRFATQCSSADHGSSATSDSTRAGTASTSSGRDKVIAHQPSRAGISRVAPPAETRPPGSKPSNAARPVMISSASTVTPVRSWNWSATRRACDSTATGIPNDLTRSLSSQSELQRREPPVQYLAVGVGGVRDGVDQRAQRQHTAASVGQPNRTVDV